MLIDSHCHLDRIDPEACGSVEAILDRARAADIQQFLCIATHEESFHRVKAIAEKHEDVFCTVGVHPLQDESSEMTIERIVELGQYDKVLAVGETGLDYYYADETAEWQQTSLRQHIQAAKELKKPLIIHTRDAREDTLRIFEEEGAAEVGGILHCFTESVEMAKKAIDMGFYISFSGIVTFRTADALREVASEMPLDRILVETDSPWLAPVPHRGKVNQPVYVKEVAQFLANHLDISLAELSRQTTENFRRLFPSSVA